MDIKELKKQFKALKQEDMVIDERNCALKMMNPDFERFALSEEEAHFLRQEVVRFRTEAGDLSPFNYMSKLCFIDRLLEQQECTEELMVRLITDRFFYFSEYRELGNLLEDGAVITNAPELDALIRDFKYDAGGRIIDGPIRKVAKLSPRSLLQEGIEGLAGLACADSAQIEIARECFLKFLYPKPNQEIEMSKLKKLFYERCFERNLSPSQVDTVFYPYRAALENHRRANLSYQQEWIPTTVHQYFWKERQKNYDHMQQTMTHRADDMMVKQRIIQRLNELATWCANKTCETVLDTHRKLHQNLVDLFETYLRTLLHEVRNKEYLPVLTWADKRVEERPYARAIERLLAACLIGEQEYDPLSALFIYQAFTNNTKVVMGNIKPKLVRKIHISSKPARIKSLTSMTGRRAAVNLVLYQRLCALLIKTNQSLCLLGREDAGSCKETPFADNSLRKRMNWDGCFEKIISKNPCPYARSVREWNDWGFVLTTGYGIPNLFYHKYSEDDRYKVSYNEIYPDKKKETDDVLDSGENVLQCAQYSIFRYQYDFTKPIALLEGEIDMQIKNCIPNRPWLLTSTQPNSYQHNNENPFYAPYGELSMLLLQDMHLPSMRRICRRIKKILSEHPEYLEKYRMLLTNLTTTTEIIFYLKSIINKHELEQQILMYASFQLSGKSYNIREGLYAVLEYEMRAQIYEGVQKGLTDLAVKTFNSELFLYPGWTSL